MDATFARCCGEDEDQVEEEEEDCDFRVATFTEQTSYCTPGPNSRTSTTVTKDQY